MRRADEVRRSPLQSSWSILATSGLALVMAAVWLGAPLLPAVTGALGAAAVLYARSRATHGAS